MRCCFESEFVWGAYNGSPPWPGFKSRFSGLLAQRSTTELSYHWAILPLSYPSTELFYHWAILPLSYPTTELSFHWAILPLSYPSTELSYHWAILPLSYPSTELSYHWAILPLSYPTTELSFRPHRYYNRTNYLNPREKALWLQQGSHPSIYCVID